MGCLSILNEKQSPTGLPISGNFTTPTGTTSGCLAFSGSAWTRSAGTLLQIQVLLNGAVVGTAQIMANAANTHMAFPTAFFPVTLSAGASNTYTIQEQDGTPIVTDQNDAFNLALIY